MKDMAKIAVVCAASMSGSGMSSHMAWLSATGFDDLEV